MAKIGLAAVRLGLDIFRGDLSTFAGLSPQQLVAVGVLVALGVIGCPYGRARTLGFLGIDIGVFEEKTVGV